MRRLRIGLAVVFLASFALGSNSAIAADQDAELRDTLHQQGEVIQQLRSEVERMRDDQRRSDDRVRALQDELTNRPGAGVDADYVDKRIEQFGLADESRLFLSGYGTAGYMDAENQPSTFMVQFNPIFHFRLTDRLHFNAEFEIEIESGEGEGHGAGTTTELGMEFATIDYIATDWLTLTAGQFLLPFNVFGPKLHPQWINKMASAPPIYSAHAGGGIVPILNDVGIMASGGARLWNDESKFNYAVYLTNGWGVLPGEEDEHEEEGGHEGGEDLDFAFGTTPDINNNKAVGGRIGFLPIPNLELGASYQTGRTNSPGGRYNLFGFDAWYWRKGLELRGEYIRRAQDTEAGDLDEWGYYLQAGYRLSHLLTDTERLNGFLGRLEPVLRWGQILDAGDKNRKQLAIGLNYWLYESVPLKVTYELNRGGVDEDRLFFQLSYGF